MRYLSGEKTSTPDDPLLSVVGGRSPGITSESISYSLFVILICYSSIDTPPIKYYPIAS